MRSLGVCLYPVSNSHGNQNSGLLSGLKNTITGTMTVIVLFALSRVYPMRQKQADGTQVYQSLQPVTGDITFQSRGKSLSPCTLSYREEGVAERLCRYSRYRSSAIRGCPSLDIRSGGFTGSTGFRSVVSVRFIVRYIPSAWSIAIVRGVKVTWTSAWRDGDGFFHRGPRSVGRNHPTTEVTIHMISAIIRDLIQPIL